MWVLCDQRFSGKRRPNIKLSALIIQNYSKPVKFAVYQAQARLLFFWAFLCVFRLAFYLEHFNALHNSLDDCIKPADLLDVALNFCACATLEVEVRWGDVVEKVRTNSVRSVQQTADNFVWLQRRICAQQL